MGRIGLKLCILLVFASAFAVAGDSNRPPDIFPWYLDRVAYEKYLRQLPTAPTAPENISEAEVNRFLVATTVCRFYAWHSPSVVKGVIRPKPRVRIVTSPEHLLDECRRILASKGRHFCSAIELGGHSTQSVGLDAVIGIDRQPRNPKADEDKYMRAVASCFDEIAKPEAPVIFTTCGAERDDEGNLRFWVEKERAQRDLATVLRRPVISGRGPVCGVGARSATSPEGWYKAEPEPAAAELPEGNVPKSHN